MIWLLGPEAPGPVLDLCLPLVAVYVDTGPTVVLEEATDITSSLVAGADGSAGIPPPELASLVEITSDDDASEDPGGVNPVACAMSSNLYGATGVKAPLPRPPFPGKLLFSLYLADLSLEDGEI